VHTEVNTVVARFGLRVAPPAGRWRSGWGVAPAGVVGKVLAWQKWQKHGDVRDAWTPPQ